MKKLPHAIAVTSKGHYILHAIRDIEGYLANSINTLFLHGRSLSCSVQVQQTDSDQWSIYLSIVYIDWKQFSRISNRELPSQEWRTCIFSMHRMCSPTEVKPRAQVIKLLLGGKWHRELLSLLPTCQD